MKLILKIAAGVFLGIAAILIIHAIPGWVQSASTKDAETQMKLDNLNAQVAQQSTEIVEKERELEDQIWNLETPAQRKRQTEFAKQLANMTPNQLIAACGCPSRIASDQEAEDTLRIFEYSGNADMGFRYPKDSAQAPYLGVTDTIPDHSIGSWGWGQELVVQLPCVKEIVGRGR